MPQVLIVDEHGVYRRGLRSLIEARIRRARVFETSDLASAFPLFECEPSFDLVLIDSHSLVNQSRESLRQAYDLSPSTRFAVLSASPARTDALKSLAAGFHGFVHKLQPDEELVSAIVDLLAGRIHVPRWVADGYEGTIDYVTRADGPTIIPTLTPRQNEVLALLARGKSTKEIAQELNIAEGTTKIHTAALLRSLGARNRTEAVFKAASLIGTLSGAAQRTSERDRSRPTSPAEERARVVRLALPSKKANSAGS